MTRDLWAKETATRLLGKHKKTLKNWSQEDLEIWLRDDCRCVYCGRNLLGPRDITYFLYCYDHLLPVSRYPALKNALWNKVLACRSCNSWKSTFNPAPGGIAADEAHREELIERTKASVREQRKPAEALFLEEVEVITAALRGYES